MEFCLNLMSLRALKFCLVKVFESSGISVKTFFNVKEHFNCSKYIFIEPFHSNS